MTGNTDDTLDRWTIQLRKGVLEFVILLTLQEREHYSYELISGIARNTTIAMPEGTLYPLLLRLVKDGLIVARQGAGDGGAPRKYYSLTPRGAEILGAMKPAWSHLTHSINCLLAGTSS